jgi:hypothetical protein
MKNLRGQSAGLVATAKLISIRPQLTGPAGRTVGRSPTFAPAAGDLACAFAAPATVRGASTLRITPRSMVNFGPLVGVTGTEGPNLSDIVRWKLAEGLRCSEHDSRVQSLCPDYRRDVLRRTKRSTVLQGLV